MTALNSDRADVRHGLEKHFILSEWENKPTSFDSCPPQRRGAMNRGMKTGSSGSNHERPSEKRFAISECRSMPQSRQTR